MSGMYRKNSRTTKFISLFIVLALIFTFIFSMNKYFRKTDNLSTKEGKDGEYQALLNPNWNQTVDVFDVDPDKIVSSAIDLANSDMSFSQGCIGVVNETLKRAVGSSNCSLAASTKYWHGNSKIKSRDGSSFLKIGDYALYKSTTYPMNGNTWWNTLYMVGDENNVDGLRPGDIIVGDGHAMIYLGQAASYEQLNTNLEEKYNKKFNTNRSSDSTNGSYYKEYTGSTTYSTFWVIDANGDGGTARISNYNWTDTSAVGKSWNLNNMKVYRFRGTTGSYRVYLNKFDASSRDTIGGFSYYLQKKVNGASSFSATQEVSNESNGTSRKVAEVNIDGTYLDTPDVYMFTENVQNANKKGYIGDSNTYSITVYKTRSGSKYLISSVAFSLGNSTVNLAEEGDYYIFRDGNGIKSELKQAFSEEDWEKALANITVDKTRANISFRGINTKKGEYQLWLSKYDSSGNYIGDKKIQYDITSSKIEGGTKTFETGASEPIVSTDITDLEDDTYTFQEKDGSSAGYITDNTEYELKVHKNYSKREYYVDYVTCSVDGHNAQINESAWYYRDGENISVITESVLNEKSDEEKKEIFKNIIMGIGLGKNSSGKKTVTFRGINTREGNYELWLKKYDELGNDISETDISYDVTGSKIEGGTKTFQTASSNQIVATDITDLEDDTYVFQEKNASSEGYITDRTEYELKVHKSISEGNYIADYVTCSVDQHQTHITESTWFVRNGTEITSITDAVLNTKTDEEKAEIFKNVIMGIAVEKNVDDDNGTSTSFIYRGANKHITGEYSLRVKKVIPDVQDNFDLMAPVDGVVFKVNGDNLVPTGTDDSGAGCSYIVKDKEITKDNVGYSDDYCIEEIDLGDNRGLVKLREPVSIWVNTGLDSSKTKYVAKYAGFNTGDQEVADLGEGYVSQDFELEDGTKVKVAIKVENGDVLLVIPNEEEGKYNFNIGKKSTETYSPNFPNEGTPSDSDFISGASFKVVQYLNTDITKQERYVATGESNIASRDGEATPVTFNDTADITINNIEEPDCYVIEEVQVPAGYIKNEGTFCIKVLKEKDPETRELRIKTVQIYAKRGNTSKWEKGQIAGSLESDPNGENHTVLWGATGTVYNIPFRIELDKETNTITFVVADIPMEGKYNFILEKTNSKGNRITEGTADFKVYVYNSMARGDLGVTLSGKVDLYDSEDNIIPTSKLQSLHTREGVCEELKDIKIQDEDITKTYYFLIHEESAPGAYTKLRYDVVVPVTYAQGIDTYEATFGNAFAFFDAHPNENFARGTKVDLNTVKGDTVGVKVSQSGISIQTSIPNTQSGSYNFSITKIDASGLIIKDEKTKFDVSIYDNENLTGEEITISNADGTINTKNLEATTGIAEDINGVIINGEDINKTYYFVVTETQAPDDYTKINYEIVVPISFREENGQYKVTKGEAFAVVRNGNGEVVQRGTLSEFATDTTTAASTEQIDATINVNVPNKHKQGLYNFRIVKVDNNGETIDDEEAEFDVSIYNNSACQGREVTLSKMVVDNQGNSEEVEIQSSELKGQKTIAGIIKEVTKNIVIHSTDISSDKTYYFRVHESKAPYSYTGISYDVVVPVSFIETSSGYRAVKGEAYAIDEDGEIKTLEEVATDNVRAASTSQIDTAIIVNIPNKQKTGKYSVKLLKVNNKNNSPIANAVFNIVVSPISSLSRSGVETDASGILDITDGDVTIVGNGENTGDGSSKVGQVDTFKITEVGAQSYLKLKHSLILNIEKTEKDDRYDVSRITLSEQYRANSVSIDVTDTNRSLTLNNVLLSDDVSKVNITVSINSDNEITVTVPNKELEGKFKVDLVKVDSKTKEKLSNIPFKVNNIEKQTDSNGNIDITENDEESDGYVKITKDTLSANTYTIQEIENESNINYAVIDSPITLTINKGQDADGKKYMVTSVDITYTSNSGEQTEHVTDNQAVFYVKTKGSTTETKCTLQMTSEGNIKIEAENIRKDGNYELSIVKNVEDDDGNAVALPGVTFEVRDIVSNVASIIETQEEGEHSVAGTTESVHKSITKENVANTDVFIVSEERSVQEDVVKLKNNLRIEVTKGLCNDESKYVIKTIKLSEVSKTSDNNVINGPQEINPVQENAANVITLSNVELENGKKVDIVLSTTPTHITMYIKNKRPEGEYQLRIRKINSVTGESISGITFFSTGAQCVSDSTTTGENGIGEFRVRNIESTHYEHYSIREDELPPELQGKVIPITDFSFEVYVYPKLNKDTMTYVVGKDDIQMTVSQIATSETTELQRKIANEATLDVSNNIITLTIKNQSTTDYNLKIRKINTNNEALKDAKFTVYEDDVAIINNKSVNDLINEGTIESTQDYYWIKRTAMPGVTSHKYKIYENSPALGYKNILDKVFIVINVQVKEDGTLKIIGPSHYGDVDAGGTYMDGVVAAQRISEYLESLDKQELEIGDNNTITLNIPNPKVDIPMSLKLLKHTTASEENGVTGAVFTTKRLVISNEQTPTNADEVIARLNVAGENLDPFTTDANNLIKDVDLVSEAVVGSSYYYMLTESTIPGSFKGIYQKAVVRIHANIDKTITASLVAALPVESTTWITDTSLINSNYLSVSNPEGNTAEVKWANEFDFEVDLYKKAYKGAVPKDTDGNTNWGGMTPIPGAHFTVKQIEGNTETYVRNYNGNEMNNLECDYLEIMRHLDATTEKTYHYTFVENSSRPNYINIFEGVTIHLYVTTTADGKISRDSNKTYYYLEGATTEKANFLKDKIGLTITDQRVDIYIANEEVTLNMKVKKVSTSSVDGEVTCIPGVTFGVVYNAHSQSKTITTDENGEAFIDEDISIIGRNGLDYELTETSVPDGVNALTNVRITVNVDLTNANDNINNITDNDIYVSVAATGAGGQDIIDELDLTHTITAHIENGTITVEIPNKSKAYRFSMVKTNTDNGIINSSDGNGAPKFRVVKQSTTTTSGGTEEHEDYGEILNNYLYNGAFAENQVAKPKTVYKYSINETSAKSGYINILEGYELNVYVSVNEGGSVEVTHDNGLSGNTYYELVSTSPNARYTVEEIVENEWIKLQTPGNDQVLLTIKNPYEYKLQINKKDKTGSYNVDKATILAERIGNARINDLFIASQSGGSADTKKQVLSEIAGSTSVVKEVELNRASTVTSEKMEISSNNSSMPLDGIAHVWRITETDVEAPYYNILEGKYLIVPTMFKDQILMTVDHYTLVNDSPVSVPFYVCDATGEDYTSDYVGVISVTPVENNGEWTLSVTIKDPMKIRLKFNKVELASEDASEDSQFTALPGATVEINDTTAGKSYSISSGASSTELIDLEVGVGNTEIFTIRETASAPGHTNIFNNKQIILAVRTLPNDPANITIGMVDLTNGETITGTQFYDLLRYINVVQSEDEDGYTVINVYIENPIEIEFKLEKYDSAENLLPGTDIVVSSSNSGTHSIGGNSSVGFTDGNLKPGDIITYTIREYNTVPNSGYVNKFKDKSIIIIARVQNNGTIAIIQGIVVGPGPDGTVQNTPISEVDGVSYSISTVDGKQTIYVKLENELNIDINVQKRQLGVGATVIPMTKFTLTNHKGEVLQNQYTDANGNISFNNVEITPGTYTYKVEEISTASSRYVNMLENKYVLVNFTVGTYGEITINSTKIFNADNTEILTSQYGVLGKYVSTNVDDTNPIEKLNIFIYNPVKIDFDLYKKDVDTNELQDVHMEAKRFKYSSSSQDFVIDAMTDENGYMQVDNGAVDPGAYRYEIKELATAGNQYINILDGLKLVVFVRAFPDGTIKLADKTGTAFSSEEASKYYIYDDEDNEIVDRNKLEEINKYLSVTVDDTSYHVIATLQNPSQYELDIIKKNSDDQVIGNDEEGYAKFSVRRDDGTLILDNVNITTAVERIEKELDSGTHTYYVTENSTLPGYINILENKFIKFTINVTGKGVVTVTGFDVYEGSFDNVNNGTLLTREENTKLYENIDVTADDENNDNIYTIRVKVINPDITYDIALNKKIFGEEEINLSNTKFTISSEFSGTHTLFTDRYGNIKTFTEKRVPAGIYKYLITENQKPGDQFVNVFKNKDEETNLYVEVMLKVNEDGTIEIVDEEGNSENGKYYIYKQRIEDDRTFDPVNFNDTVLDEFVRVDTTRSDDVSVLNFYVADPERYNFELIKKDKDTDERMNNVEFSVGVYDERGNRITLRDAETLENIDISSLTTHTENGVDGAITIPNILIEKTGKYIFTLHEVSTERAAPILYKSWATDIRIEIEIGISGGKYVVKTYPKVLTGNAYVDFVTVTESRAQFVHSEVTNERIKGKYNLIIDKLDSVTAEALNGAEFDISVEKSTDSTVYNENKLYRFTDDVESMDVIIPGHFVVNGEEIVENIRIEQPETYILTLTETKAPEGYMLLDKPIKLQVTTGVTGESGEEKFVIQSVELIDDENHDLVSFDYTTESITVIAKNEYFDLALRKSITSVAYADKDDAKITEEETANRVPEVVADDLLAGETTTANYNHVKNHVRGYVNQDVIYTLRVYNEGEIDGYVEEITDHLPEGLEFVNDDFNAARGWRLDENDESLRTVKTTYLSENNNPNNDRFNKTNNLIKKVNTVTGEIDYKEIEIKCRIKQGVKAKTVLTNIAEISMSKAADRTAETVDRDSHTVPGANIPGTNEGMQAYKEDELTDDRNTYVPGQEDDDDFEKVIVEEFDLALRKYIIAVNDKELLNKNAEKDIKYEREPVVNATALKDGSSTTATYTHPKEEAPVEVTPGDIVTYTIQIFNEGTVSGYANLIKDDIPEGLEFVGYTKGDGSTNDIYRWKMVDANDNEVTDPAKAKYVMTDYLSKDNESKEGDNLIEAFDPENMDKPASKYVRVAFKVICKPDYPKIIKNEAQISDDTDANGKEVTDRDSTTNVWLGEDDEDVEFIKVIYFDLALRKWVTKAIVTVDGKTTVTETGHHAEDDPEEVVKVDLKKSKLDSVVVKFEYQIRVTNEGLVAGYAEQVKDYIPEGLRFEQADNPTWVQISDDEVVTEELIDTLLQPGESAEVTIVLTWINSKTNMGVKTNIAEISRDRNDRGLDDIDSTPNNKVAHEDDIDDAPVMLSIKTGSETTKYAITVLVALAILGLGVGLVKDFRKEKE